MTDILISISNKKYPTPLSIALRFFHLVIYISGGVIFAYGSYQYFPDVSNYSLGGLLFTIGATGFVIADFLEWWANKEEFIESYESIATSKFAPNATAYQNPNRPKPQPRQTPFGK